MRKARAALARIGGLFGRRRESEFAAELDSHLALHIEDNVRTGMTPEEARRQALIKLGGLEQTKESYRERRSLPLLENLIQDFGYALRGLRKSPGFAAIAICTLALGIGANTAIFSLIDAIMLRQLPVENPGQLVLFGTGRAEGSTGGVATEVYSYRFYEEIERRNPVFSGVSSLMSVMFEKMHGSVDASARLEPMNVQLVSGAYFPVLGVKPVRGQSFTRAEDEPLGAHPVAMISYSWWTRRFARSPAVLGKPVRLGSTVYTIIGVAPPGFFGTTVGAPADLWIPLSMEKQLSPDWNGLDDPWFDSLYILARLKPGVSRKRAEASVNVLAQAIWRGFSGPVISPHRERNIEQAWIPLTSFAQGRSPLRFQYSLPLQILMGVVGLVLLIACANIANLLLARGANRGREIALRMALGAGRSRLVRQMLAESLLLACLGGALGILFASWAGKALLSMLATGSEPLPLDVAPDARVLAFTFLVSLATALLFGALPALRATRISLTSALKQGRGAAPAASRSPLAKALIVSQVALSLLLLAGAGLFLRTLANLGRVDTGFDEKNVLLFGIDPPAVGYQTDARLLNLYRRIEQRVEAQPGVRAASISSFTFNEGEWRTPVTVEEAGPVSDDVPNVLHNVVGPDYFATMGIPLLAGRGFGPQDTATSPKVAVINQTMARLYFPGGSPLGRRFGFPVGGGQSPEFEVVGVARDAKYLSLDEPPSPAAYYSYSQPVRDRYYYDLDVRYAGDARAIVAEVRDAVAQVDPRLPVVFESSLAEKVGQSLASQSLIARLSAFFGLLAVFLASIGIYGLTSYAVSRRTNEIGIRVALGAAQPHVLWMVMRESLILAGLGLAIGLPVTLAAGPLVSSLLFGLSPADPETMLAAAALLLALAALAGYLPARRAARVDPMVALRQE